MDKSRKTKWERQMKKLMIIMIIVLPLLVGLAIWLIAKLSRPGP
jgi:flagellar biogenesis protein FliO